MIKRIMVVLIVLLSFACGSDKKQSGDIQVTPIIDEECNTISPNLKDLIQVAPTLIDKSLLRGGPGKICASRGNGKKHKGVDIVSNQSSNDKSIYKVVAVSSGVIAYAMLNGSDETGYGYTVVVDHQNGFYTQYSHLAKKTSSGLVKLGDNVQTGQIIGYLADLSIDEKSSGNVLADVVKPYDKIQLHFEVFQAPSGRKSETALSILKKDYQLVDPTNRVKELGYNSF